MDDNDFEKQKFELKIKKLELEQQKVDFEKSKFENKTVKDENTEKYFTNNLPVSLNIISFIAAGVLIITPFLPWATSSVSGFGASFQSSANGFECGHGYYILLFAVAAIVLAYMKNKFVFIPGILALVDGLTVVTGMGSHSSSFMGASVNAGFAIGPILVIISSLVLIASPFLKEISKPSGGKSIDFKSFFITYKFHILVSLTALLIIIPISENNIDSIIGLILYLVIPLLLLKYLKFEKTYHLFFALPIFYSFYFIGHVLVRESQFRYNYNDSLIIPSILFGFVFYLGILTAFIIDIISQKKKEVLPASIDKCKFIFKPIVPLLVFFIPFIGFFSYYTVTRHQITDEEAKKFETTNSYFSGNWYFMNKDSTSIFILQVLPVYSGERYNTGTLATKIEYRLFKSDEQFIESKTLDTTLAYDAKIELPLTFQGGTEISTLKDDLLSVKLKLSDGTFYILKAIKDKNVLASIIESKNQQKKDLYLNQSEVYVQDSILFIGIYSGKFGKNQLTLSIEEVNTQTKEIKGWGETKGTKRSLTGNYEELDGVYTFTLYDVLGDEEWDGVFECTMVAQDINSLGGKWSSGNGDLTRDFILIRN